MRYVHADDEDVFETMRKAYGSEAPQKFTTNAVETTQTPVDSPGTPGT